MHPTECISPPHHIMQSTTSMLQQFEFTPNVVRKLHFESKSLSCKYSRSCEIIKQKSILAEETQTNSANILKENETLNTNPERRTIDLKLERENMANLETELMSLQNVNATL